MTPPYTYINADELAQIIKEAPSSTSTSETKPIQVVDVRDDDFRGGNIVGARNVPSESFAHDENREALRSLAEELKDVPKVVFHCALSQVRGPKAARMYSEVRKEILGEKEGKEQEVLVLRQGFSGFQSKFRVSEKGDCFGETFNCRAVIGGEVLSLPVLSRQLHNSKDSSVRLQRHAPAGLSAGGRLSSWDLQRHCVRRMRGVMSIQAPFDLERNDPTQRIQLTGRSFSDLSRGLFFRLTRPGLAISSFSLCACLIAPPCALG